MPIAFPQFRPFAKNNQKTCPSWTAKKYALSLDSEHYFFTNSELSNKLKRWIEYVLQGLGVYLDVEHSKHQSG